MDTLSCGCELDCVYAFVSASLSTRQFEIPITNRINEIAIVFVVGRDCEIAIYRAQFVCATQQFHYGLKIDIK